MMVSEPILNAQKPCNDWAPKAQGLGSFPFPSAKDDHVIVLPPSSLEPKHYIIAG